MQKKYITLLIISLALSCTKKEKLFTKVSPSTSHVQFNNRLTPTPDLNILNYLYYYNGAGIAAADFNNDGLIDLFFTGNQVQDKLYLNKGNLQFQDITISAGITLDTNWSTGVSHVDINNDGLLDIYICKASGYRALEGKNLLYINQGINDDGIPQFKEDAKSYGLDFAGLSTHAAFFDYDLDGDLDAYLLNHSVHPNHNYGRGSQRNGFSDISGDVLLENQNGKYVDVSKKSGIFQGKSGYGLGVSISDINNDGYPDIYVGNDFFENDYLYINQKDGTFKETITQNKGNIGHTSHFSMGNNIADINNDGLVDIMSLDMLPENLETYKTSGLEYGYSIYNQYLKNGYAPQYMQNSFQLNTGGGYFSEISHLSQISATEWSWGTLLADFDNDGHKDLFISNGIKGATNDMDYLRFISNEDIQKRIDQGMTKTDMPLVSEIPEKKVSNYFFKNNGDLTFQNVTNKWFQDETSFSNGTITADLDNDGDLDIVVNNVNETAHILENNSKKGNYLKIEFKGPLNNPFGIGAKVLAYSSETLLQENHIAKGYLSATPPIVHLGLGNDSIIDSIKVSWPGGKTEVLKFIKSNTTITVNYKNAIQKKTSLAISEKKHFTLNDTLVNYTHKEYPTLDFDRSPLIPFANSNNGPSISVIDVNNDGLEDIYIGGAKKQPGALFLQNNLGTFTKSQEELFDSHNSNEDTASTFFDANGDGYQDLIVASGGNEFTTGKTMQPRLYMNTNGILYLKEGAFNKIETNASQIISGDLDNDGDIDLILTADQVSRQFGKTAKQYILINDGAGNFTDLTKQIAPALEYIGGVKDVKLQDLNKDGLLDLIVVGHWMPISILINNGKQLTLQKNNGLDNSNGWWNNITVTDIDKDGDLDFICGNWGLNSRFRASIEKPITLYRNDFDQNESIEPLVTYFHKNTQTAFASKDELVKQMPFLNKEFLSYSKFAQASLNELFGKDNLDQSEKKYVYELQSCVFMNDGNGKFTKKPLPLIAQASQINDIAIEDINNDGFNDLILIGNNHHISTQLGRLDANHGIILQNDKGGYFFWDKKNGLGITGVSRTINAVTILGKESYIIGRNDDNPIILQKN